MRRWLGLFLLAALVIPSGAFSQAALLQGGAWTPGHLPMYTGPGYSQPTVQDSGPAAGGIAGVGLSELLLAARGTGTPPYVGQGTGPLGTNFCDYDAPITNATGYHYLCLSANAQGGGILAYGAALPASSLPFQINANGVNYTFPLSVPSLAPIAANTIVGAISAGPPQALAIPGCTGALTWTSGTGFGCNSSSGITGATFTGGLISVSGSPILAFTVAGTSGGIPYFSSSSTWGSSGALTANAPVIGGGAGVAPSSGSRSGNTTTFATANGILTNGHCVSIDGSGNFVDAGGSCTTGGGGGTVSSGTANDLAYYASSGTVVTGLTSANSGVLVTSGSGVPSISTTLPSGLALGTPASATLTNATGLPILSGVSGLGTGVATFLGTPSSANLAAALTDETGSGAAVFGTSPTFVTPTLGAATATSINKVAITAPASSATLTIANGKTLTASNTLTLVGTDSSTLNIGTGGTLGTAAFQATGTSGATLPFLNGTNAWSGANTFSEVLGTVTSQSGTTYTFATTDCGTEVSFTNSSAITATIPATLPVGCNIAVLQAGTAKVSVNGSAVTPATLQGAHSYTGTSAQWAIIGLNIYANSGGSSAVAILTGDGS